MPPGASGGSFVLQGVLLSMKTIGNWRQKRQLVSLLDSSEELGPLRLERRSGCEWRGHDGSWRCASLTLARSVFETFTIAVALSEGSATDGSGVTRGALQMRAECLGCNGQLLVSSGSWTWRLVASLWRSMAGVRAGDISISFQIAMSPQVSPGGRELRGMSTW